MVGKCTFGNRCRDAHSFDAPRPPCRFHQLGKCKKGGSCLYSHTDGESSSTEQENDELICLETGQSPIEKPSLEALVPLLPHLSLPGGPIGWFEDHHNQLLLLGEGNFNFTLNLQRMLLGPVAASTNDRLTSNLMCPGFWENVDATRLHLNQRVIQQLSRIRSFAWNFPYMGTVLQEDHGENERLLAETFLSLSLLLDIAKTRFGVTEFTFAVSLQGDQFSRWSVLGSAWHTGWHLTGWSVFDHKQFPGYTPSRHNGESFPLENPRFYVFSLRRDS